MPKTAPEIKMVMEENDMLDKLFHFAPIDEKGAEVTSRLAENMKAQSAYHMRKENRGKSVLIHIYRDEPTIQKLVLTAVISRDDVASLELLMSLMPKGTLDVWFFFESTDVRVNGAPENSVSLVFGPQLSSDNASNN